MEPKKWEVETHNCCLQDGIGRAVKGTPGQCQLPWSCRGHPQRGRGRWWPFQEAGYPTSWEHAHSFSDRPGVQWLALRRPHKHLSKCTQLLHWTSMASVNVTSPRHVRQFLPLIPFAVATSRWRCEYGEEGQLFYKALVVITTKSLFSVCVSLILPLAAVTLPWVLLPPLVLPGGCEGSWDHAREPLWNGDLLAVKGSAYYDSIPLCLHTPEEGAEFHSQWAPQSQTEGDAGPFWILNLESTVREWTLGRLALPELCVHFRECACLCVCLRP